MTAGLHAVNLANKWLNTLGGTNITAPTTLAVKLHTGDPGSAATTNASANTTREAITMGSASAGSISGSGSPVASWTSWPSGANGETISHISLWDSTTAGNFLDSIAATTSRTLNTGDTLNLTSLNVALTPIAA